MGLRAGEKLGKDLTDEEVKTKALSPEEYSFNPEVFEEQTGFSPLSNKPLKLVEIENILGPIPHDSSPAKKVRTLFEQVDSLLPEIENGVKSPLIYVLCRILEGNFSVVPWSYDIHGNQGLPIESINLLRLAMIAEECNTKPWWLDILSTVLTEWDREDQGELYSEISRYISVTINVLNSARLNVLLHYLNERASTTIMRIGRLRDRLSLSKQEVDYFRTVAETSLSQIMWPLSDRLGFHKYIVQSENAASIVDSYTSDNHKPISLAISKKTLKGNHIHKISEYRMSLRTDMYVRPYWRVNVSLQDNESNEQDLILFEERIDDVKKTAELSNEENLALSVGWAGLGLMSTRNAILNGFGLQPSEIRDILTSLDKKQVMQLVHLPHFELTGLSAHVYLNITGEPKTLRLLRNSLERGVPWVESYLSESSETLILFLGLPADHRQLVPAYLRGFLSQLDLELRETWLIEQRVRKRITGLFNFWKN